MTEHDMFMGVFGIVLLILAIIAKMRGLNEPLDDDSPFNVKNITKNEMKISSEVQATYDNIKAGEAMNDHNKRPSDNT